MLRGHFFERKICRTRYTLDLFVKKKRKDKKRRVGERFSKRQKLFCCESQLEKQERWGLARALQVDEQGVCDLSRGGGGQVVSAFALYSDNSSSNPDEVYGFFL